MISFYSIGFNNPLKKIRTLRCFLIGILNEHSKKDGNINIVFVDDEYLLKINNEFVHHDYYTDTITFPYHLKHSKVIEGDIFISYDRIKENAKLYKCSVQIELIRVIIHSILHLLEYQDKNGNNIIFKKQEKYLQDFLEQL